MSEPLILMGETTGTLSQLDFIVLPNSLEPQSSDSWHEMELLPSSFAIADWKGGTTREATVQKGKIVTIDCSLATRWEDETAQILNELAHLDLDWDEQGAAPPNDVAVELAKQILAELTVMNFRPLRTAPCVDEGISFSFILKGKKLAVIECYNSGEIFSVISEGKGSPQIWEVDDEDKQSIRSTLENLRAFVDRQ